ncbi:toll/interleukin-1 receptor domain-containing protein [Pseudofrankia sp. BMG5.37]|uniref:toll/interleukin-1 receptor domain-containing protein n=1 Tax=Pseudofrankia sp. BMG5.37 TaxID=3050035 RepID=UPI0028942A4A|nr:toll/interleukin-1 receptor domain-containing protein [Pseudofrankia sp. BMG5.37]MDT3438979.1 toll/interleukin-1 receptor domain-containing protein [Pseudofrankia sp. BMG5.37]
MDQAPEPATDEQVDFFISYAPPDEEHAEWIAYELEEAGYTTVIQAWDFVAGSHFVHEMHRAARNATWTVAILSSAYLGSAYAEAEWQAAWVNDPLAADGGAFACGLTITTGPHSVRMTL